MAKTKVKPVELRKGEKVVAATDLRQVPVGTTGTVMLVNGLSWIRYWVRFDNGVALGSINRSALARPEEWERRLAGGGKTDADAEAASPAAAAAVAEGSEAETVGDVTTPNGAVVPAQLVERAKRARERLGA